MEGKEGIIDILTRLDESALFSLARTVTQGLKKWSTPKEAIEDIIKYSPDDISILRRKVMTRDVLFSYLDHKNVKIQLPKTKNELIDAVTEYWHLPRVSLHSQLETPAEDSDKPITRRGEVSDMAKYFSKWFYDMLNKGQCGVEHFFPDAKFTMNIFTGATEDTVNLETPQEITRALLEIKRKRKLYFSPNYTPEGVRGRLDLHGLVVLLACGILNSDGLECTGVFEHMFALAKGEMNQNRWTIKNMKLNLRFGAVASINKGDPNELLMLTSE